MDGNWIVDIERPGRYVKFSLPFPKGACHWSPTHLPIGVYTMDGRELPCQVERQTRYADGSCASVFVYADAGSGPPPTKVEVRIEDGSEREFPAFRWHPRLRELRGKLEFARDASGRLLPPTINGPVCVQRRLHGRVAWATFFTDCPSVYVVGIDHRGNPGDADDYCQLSTGLGGVDNWVSYPFGESRAVLGEWGWIPQRGGRPYRYLFVHDDEGPSALNINPMAGLGVAHAAWRSIGAIAPHFVPCTDLSHIPGLGNSQTAAWAGISSAMSKGTEYPAGHGYVHSRRIGLMHPTYSREGGETSGSQIDFGQGRLQGFLETGNCDAISHAMAEQFGRLSRDRWLIVDGQEPATWEAFAPGDKPIGGWRLSVDDPGRFDKSAGRVLDGPFGFSTALPSNAVIPSDHPAVSLDDLKAFECTDWGHVIRSAQWDAMLAQAINCPLSRWLLRARGELARMAWKSGGRQASDIASSQVGMGIPRDRILGWQWWCIALAYTWGGNGLRDRFWSDMKSAQDIVLDATRHVHTVCALTGGKQADRDPYNKQYAVCVQPTGEVQLWMGALACARALDSHLSTAIADGALGAMTWLNRGSSMVWSAAVYRKSDSHRYLQRDDTLSSVAWPSGQYDNEQALGLLGLIGLTAEQPGLGTLLENMLGPNPKAALESKGMSAVDSDLTLLAWAQR